eukprot:1161810-Pelagomonas_calceolata.AAC.3
MERRFAAQSLSALCPGNDVASLQAALQSMVHVTYGPCLRLTHSLPQASAAYVDAHGLTEAAGVFTDFAIARCAECCASASKGWQLLEPLGLCASFGLA